MDDTSDTLGPVSSVPVLDSEVTVTLLTRVQGGDAAALNHLLERCLPPLRRWALGQLPPGALAAEETTAFIEETVIAAVRRLDRLDARREGSLQAYLRQALRDRIADLPLPAGGDADRKSPLESMIGAQNMARYEAALRRLRDEDREAIIARIELQYTYQELAVALEKPTANAARVAVTRALQRLAEELPRVSALP